MILQKQEESLDKARSFKPIQRYDEYRAPDAYKEGGFPMVDKEVINKFKTCFKEIIKKIGKQLLSGKF